MTVCLPQLAGPAFSGRHLLPGRRCPVAPCRTDNLQQFSELNQCLNGGQSFTKSLQKSAELSPAINFQIQAQHWSAQGFSFNSSCCLIFAQRLLRKVAVDASPFPISTAKPANHRAQSPLQHEDDVKNNQPNTVALLGSFQTCINIFDCWPSQQRRQVGRERVIHLRSHRQRHLQWGCTHPTC